MKRNTNSLAAIAFQKYLKNKIGMCSFGYILICGFVAIFCYLIAPDDSCNANQMHLEIHSKPPGFSTTLLEIPNPKKSTFFERFLFGEEHPPTELLIHDFKIDSTYLNVTLFDQITIKKIPLDTFNSDTEDFVKEKNLFLRYRSLWKRFIEQNFNRNAHLFFYWIYRCFHLSYFGHFYGILGRLLWRKNRCYRIVGNQHHLVYSYLALSDCHHIDLGQRSLASIHCCRLDHVGRSSKSGARTNPKCQKKQNTLKLPKFWDSQTHESSFAIFYPTSWPLLS